MIYFLITNRNRFPIRNFLRSRGKSWSERIQIIWWENLKTLRNLRAGTFVFSDFDFLTHEQREVAKKIYGQLQQRYPHLKLFNNPGKVLLRYDLLKRLHKLGINRYNVARATEPLDQLRFPVFVREADRHDGPLSGLIYSVEDLKRNIRLLQNLGYLPQDLLVIEYLDASGGDGLYHKYAAFGLDDQIVPRYLNFSRNWMVKSSINPRDTLMKSKEEEVKAYMRDNPHAGWLNRIFKEAGIGYGRADYALVNGELQLWEINLNPAFVLPPRNPSKDHAQQQYMRDSFYKQFFEKLQKIDGDSDEIIQLDISDEEIRTMRLSLGKRIRDGFHQRLIKNKPHYRAMRAICFAAARMWTRYAFKAL